jgi:hypothetical protein
LRFGKDDGEVEGSEDVVLDFVSRRDEEVSSQALIIAGRYKMVEADET